MNLSLRMGGLDAINAVMLREGGASSNHDFIEDRPARPIKRLRLLDRPPARAMTTGVYGTLSLSISGLRSLP
jgi:hypothetical protein